MESSSESSSGNSGGSGRVDTVAAYLERNSMPCYSPHDSFWPRTVLKDLMTRQKVEQALAESDFQNGDILRYADMTLPTTTEGSTADSGEEEYLNIFVVLILHNWGSWFPNFVKSRISDSHLPFSKSGSGAGRFLIDKDGKKVGCCSDWDTHWVDSFHSYQHRVTVPLLAFDERGMPKHYAMDPSAILPWTRVGSNGATTEVWGRGGYGVVEWVKMHDKCHDFGQRLGPVPVCGYCRVSKRG